MKTATTIVERLAFFPLQKTGSVCGKWTGRLASADQKAIFGRNLCGKREIEIDGQRETIRAKERICFGTDCGIEDNKLIRMRTGF